jgi:hypothetical protein
MFFDDLANTFRSLTRSPITTAINEAHKMARRHLEAGGAAVAAPGPASERSPGFVLPRDVDPRAVQMAIDGKLRAGRGLRYSTSEPPVALEVVADGRTVVPGTSCSGWAVVSSSAVSWCCGESSTTSASEGCWRWRGRRPCVIDAPGAAI